MESTMPRDASNAAGGRDADVPEPLPVFTFDASKDNVVYALNDLKAAVARPRLLRDLIKTSFFGRYRGTVLGGFWITATTFMMVAGLALLYSRILGNDLAEYFPYVAIGIIVWALISTLVNEGVAVFISTSTAYNQAPIPKSTFSFRLVGTSFLSMMFKVIIIIGVMAWFRIPVTVLSLLQAAAGLVLILWTGFWFSLFIGTIATKFKDIGQLTNAAMMFAFFLTPVFWKAGRLGDLSFVVKYNPLHHYINTIRGALLGYEGLYYSFYWALGTSAVVTALGLTTFCLFATRIVYWS